MQRKWEEVRDGEIIISGTNKRTGKEYNRMEGKR
jgi:hypothetical protein